MAMFLIRRLYSGALVLVGVVVAVFIITRVVGDPLATILPLESTAAQRAMFAHQLGLDRPIWVQFGEFVAKLSRFDLGESLWQKRPVTEMVLGRFPFTLALVGVSMLLAVLMAIPLGIVAAVRPGGAIDRFTVSLSLLGLSVPQFWLGLLLILVFAVQLKLVPTSGSGEIAHLILPALTMALPAMARMVMVIRSSLIDELNAQYVRVQIAKGMPFRRVVGVHALRNIASGIITLAGWEFIRGLAGMSVIVETLFAWPGIGLMAMQAITNRDLTLLQGIVFYVALSVVLFNLLLDIAQKLVDPRIELS